MKQALLIIDVQNDYFPNQKMELAKADIAVENINKLEDKFLHDGNPIIYIQHIKNVQNADFFGVGTFGAELHQKLKFNDKSIIIEKHYPNSFFETNLLQQLKKLQVDQLVITGMMTHMCVDSTTRAAKEFNFNPILIGDATATKDLSFSDRKISAEKVQLSFLSALQNFATVIKTNEFLKND